MNAKVLEVLDITEMSGYFRVSFRCRFRASNGSEKAEDIVAHIDDGEDVVSAIQKAIQTQLFKYAIKEKIEGMEFSITPENSTQGNDTDENNQKTDTRTQPNIVG